KPPFHYWTGKGESSNFLIAERCGTSVVINPQETMQPCHFCRNLITLGSASGKHVEKPQAQVVEMSIFRRNVTITTQAVVGSNPTSGSGSQNDSCRVSGGLSRILLGPFLCW